MRHREEGRDRWEERPSQEPAREGEGGGGSRAERARSGARD